MALKDIQTNKNDLREYLLLIAKVPEKVNKIDIDIKKELLIDIDQRVISILHTINSRLIACPNETFEYCASNTFQVFNYYELKNLKDWIESSIKQSNVKTEIKDLEAKEPENIYLGYPTNENANKLFDYLNKYYRPNEKTVVKYVNILYYLKNDTNKDLYIFNIKQNDFKQMVNSKVGIKIKKFEKSERYYEAEKPILNSLEISFRKEFLSK